MAHKAKSPAVRLEAPTYEALMETLEDMEIRPTVQYLANVAILEGLRVMAKRKEEGAIAS